MHLARCLVLRRKRLEPPPPLQRGMSYQNSTAGVLNSAGSELPLVLPSDLHHSAEPSLPTTKWKQVWELGVPDPASEESQCNSYEPFRKRAAVYSLVVDTLKHTPCTMHYEKAKPSTDLAPTHFSRAHSTRNFVASVVAAHYSTQRTVTTTGFTSDA